MNIGFNARRKLFKNSFWAAPADLFTAMVPTRAIARCRYTQRAASASLRQKSIIASIRFLIHCFYRAIAQVRETFWQGRPQACSISSSTTHARSAERMQRGMQTARSASFQSNSNASDRARFVISWDQEPMRKFQNRLHGLREEAMPHSACETSPAQGNHKKPCAMR